MFWRVRIERHFVDLHAVQRQDALATMLGSTAIARAMGPDEEMTRPAMDALTITICEDCSTENISIAQIAEEAAP
jgi:hypothetical protein